MAAGESIHMRRTRSILLLALITVLAPSAGYLSADVFSDVPEAAGYQLVYDLPIGNGNSFGGGSVPYATNNAGSIPYGSFSRVGYYMQLQSPSDPNPIYAYASFNAQGFTGNAAMLGVPTQASGGAVPASRFEHECCFELAECSYRHRHHYRQRGILAI